MVGPDAVGASGNNSACAIGAVDQAVGDVERVGVRVVCNEQVAGIDADGIDA